MHIEQGLECNVFDRCKLLYPVLTFASWDALVIEPSSEYSNGDSSRQPIVLIASVFAKHAQPHTSPYHFKERELMR